MWSIGKRLPFFRGTGEQWRNYLGRYFEGVEPLCGAGSAKMLLLPHIDFQRGTDSYRAAFSVLRAIATPDVIVIFGTDHLGGIGSLFHLTRRSYSTALGEVRVAQDAVDVIENHTGRAIFWNEGLHDREWSIETPLLVLQSAFPSMPAIVPIIVTEVPGMFAGDFGPEARSTRHFIDAVTTLINALSRIGKRVLVVSGVDLSHCGSSFEGQSTVEEMGVAAIEQIDMLYLRSLLRLRPHEGEEAVGKNVTRIDAIAPAGVSMRAAVEAGLVHQGRLIRYMQSHNTEEDCLVSHATAYWM